MTRVSRLVTTALAVPLLAGGAFIATTTGAGAEQTGCDTILTVHSCATITSPSSGSYTVGSTIFISGSVTSMVSATARLSGPSASWSQYLLGNESFSSSFTPTSAGTYTVEVVGNVSGHVYDVVSVDVQPKPAPSKTHQASSGGSGGGSSSGGSGSGSNSGSDGSVPADLGGDSGNFSVPTDIPTLGVKSSSSPYSLPSVSPDGTGEFSYTTPSPDVAGNGGKRLASDDLTTNGLKWGPSIAIALVLLLMSAHLSAWTRRQRFATVATPARPTPGNLPRRVLGRIGDAAVGAEDAATAALASLVAMVRRLPPRR